MKYKKKTVIIDAVQWDGMAQSLTPLVPFENCIKAPEIYPDDRLGIHTSGGILIADVGDWIIKGAKGELYPLKPNVFKLTYEPIEDVSMSIHKGKAHRKSKATKKKRGSKKTSSKKKKK